LTEIKINVITNQGGWGGGGGKSENGRFFIWLGSHRNQSYHVGCGRKKSFVGTQKVHAYEVHKNPRGEHVGTYNVSHGVGYQNVSCNSIPNFRKKQNRGNLKRFTPGFSNV